MRTWYLDLFLIFNIGMNYLLLQLVKRILQLQTSLKRLWLSATVGAMWSAILYGICFPLSTFLVVITWIFLGIIMITIAFGKKEKKEFIHIVGVFWLVTLGMGGFFLMMGSIIIKQIPYICLGISGYLFLLGVISYIRNQMQKTCHFYEVVLFQQEKRIKVNALLDTGNQLIEPYTQKPVHVVTKEIYEKLKNQDTNQLYIPFQTVGVSSGLLPGIRIDAMEILQHGELKKRLEKPWLAMSKEMISTNQKYEMLLNSKA